MKPKVVVIVGPTAVGKTKISIELAKRLGGEIISADSMQLYQYMNIGTAKPTAEERQSIPHHMIDMIHPTEEFNVAKYKEIALEYIKEIIKRNKIPIMVGGTGLYVDAVVQNIEFFEIDMSLEYRQELESRAQSKGTNSLHQELEAIDPDAAKKISPNDLKRIIRALEVYKVTGNTLSYYQKLSKEKPPEYQFIIIGLNMDREKLYKRIEQRVDKMIKDGLVDEVKSLIEMGAKQKSTAMQGLGYKEVIGYLQGEKTLEETIEIIKRDSRRYAKRQLTWFRKNKDIFWIDVNERDVIEKIDNYLKTTINYQLSTIN
jgi:tRNA dimethylallyltransferase